MQAYVAYCLFQWLFPRKKNKYKQSINSAIFFFFLARRFVRLRKQVQTVHIGAQCKPVDLFQNQKVCKCP